MNFKKIILFIALIIIATTSLFAWGFWGHQRINRMAVFTLPPQMFSFYKKHIDFITEHAVDPDKRRYSDPEEAARHYIDIDRYGEHPFDSLPKNWKDAIAKYGEDSLKQHGIVPWHITFMLFRLTKSFKEHDEIRILKLSAEIGHYIGDAHVPLHCTKNYNGQLTAQHGIHGFWESRLPELYGDDYDFFTGRCHYINKPVDFAWNIIKQSYAAHDSVLSIEKKLNESFDADRKYAYEEKGGMMVKVYSEEYSKAFSDLLNGMVERRMRDAIVAVSCFWYTAWCNAGMPNLDNLQEIAINDSLKVEMEILNKAYESKKGSGNGHED